MNPFDWRGPEFLLFYAVLVIATLIVLRIARRAAEAGQPDARTGGRCDDGGGDAGRRLRCGDGAVRVEEEALSTPGR